MYKVKAFSLGISTPFVNNRAFAISENVYQISDPLKSIWDYRKPISVSEEGSPKIDYLFGRVRLISNLREIKISGNYFPIEWENPVIIAKRASLNMSTVGRNFEGFVRVYDYKILSNTVPKIVILNYKLGEKCTIRGWFKVNRKDFSNTIKLELMQNVNMTERTRKIAWSDRFPE